MYFSYDVLNIFFSLAYFTIRVQYIILITLKMCVNQLFMLLVGFLINHKLLSLEE